MNEKIKKLVFEYLDMIIKDSEIDDEETLQDGNIIVVSKNNETIFKYFELYYTLYINVTIFDGIGSMFGLTKSETREYVINYVIESELFGGENIKIIDFGAVQY